MDDREEQNSLTEEAVIVSNREHQAGLDEPAFEYPATRDEAEKKNESNAAAEIANGNPTPIPGGEILGETDYTDRLRLICRLLKEGSISRESFMEGVRSDIEQSNSTGEILTGLMDLFCFDIFDRKDSPYGDYFADPLLQQTFDRMEFKDAKQKEHYLKLVRELRENIRTKLMPLYTKFFLEDTLAALKKIPPKSFKIDVLKSFIISSELHKIALLGINLPFLNEGIMNEEAITLAYAGKIVKQDFQNIESELISLNVDEKGRKIIKAYLEGKREMFKPEDIGIPGGKTFGRIRSLCSTPIVRPKRAEEIYAGFESALKFNLEQAQLKIDPAMASFEPDNDEQRRDFNGRFIDDLQSSGENMKELQKILFDYLQTQNRMIAPQSRGFDSARMKDVLGEYSLRLHQSMERAGLTDEAQIITLLGDGEPLAMVEWFKNAPNEVKMLYVSRKTMLLRDEYEDYEAEIKEKPERKYDGKFLDKYLLYSTIYNNFGGETCLFYQAKEAADRFEKGKNAEGVDKEIIERKKLSVFINTFTLALAKKIKENTRIAAKIEDIYKKQLEPALTPGKPVVFVDSGLKGTIPGLLAAIVKIKNAETAGLSLETYLEMDVNDVSIYLFSVDKFFEQTVPHFATGRKMGKPVEDAGKFSSLALTNDGVFVKSNNPKNKFLAALDAINMF